MIDPKPKPQDDRPIPEISTAPDMEGDQSPIVEEKEE